MLLKCAVGLGVFLIACPLAFLLSGAFASLMPKPSAPVAFAVVGLAYLVGCVLASHLITEKLSKRWSR
jgi:hypothetical protein